MISAATLARWAPNGNATDLAEIEAGIVKMIERESGRDFRVPKAAAEPWILDVPKAPTGGLTQYNRGEMQWLALPEQPQRQLTGTWSVTAGTAALTGSGGAALTELTTDSAVEIGDETIKVSAITDDDTVTLAANHTDGASGATIYSDFLRVSIRSTPTSTWTALHPVNDIELDRDTKLRIFSKAWNFPEGRRRVKVEALLGYAEESGPADLILLMRDMVCAWDDRQAGGLKSERVEGVALTYTDFGSSGVEFQPGARPRLAVAEGRMNTAQAMAAVRRSISRSEELTLALSREVDTLSDSRLGKGEPVPLEVSGAHAEDAETLTIAPQATWIFRGGVESGTPVTITGDATSYATTAKVTVDDKSPDTLALPITPGLSAALSGGEVVTLDEAASVSYSCRKVSDTEAASRGWQVKRGSGVYLVDHESKRAPDIGDIASNAHTGSVLNVDGNPFPYSLVQIGGAA